MPIAPVRLRPYICFVFLCFVQIVAGFVEPAEGLRAQSIHFTRTLDPLTGAIAFNPLSHGLVVYAGLKDTEGIYKSYDGGYHWKHLKGGPNPLEAGSSDDIGQIFIMPTDTSVLLVGSTNPRYGIYRSIDGGYNWKRVLENVSSEGLTIFEKPDHLGTGHDTVLFGESVSGHIWRSLDKGQTWDSLHSTAGQPKLCTIVVDPKAPNTYLAGAGGGAICRTTNGGQSWDTTHPTEASGLADIPRIQFDPINPARVWATIYYHPTESLLRSDDGGKTWRTRPSPSDEWAFDLDPARPNRMWMGRFSGVHPQPSHHFDQSTDGGLTWTDEGLDTVVDIWMIKYDSASGRLAVATSSGVFIAEVGTREVKASQEMAARIYPNPARETFSFNSEAAQLEVIDLLGRRMWISSSHHLGAVNVSLWPNGVYSFVERAPSGLKTTRLVVSH